MIEELHQNLKHSPSESLHHLHTVTSNPRPNSSQYASYSKTAHNSL